MGCEPAAVAAAPLPRMSISAPPAPKAIPATFFPVTGSRRNTAARSIAHKGILVVIIDASAGDDSLTPKMKLP